MVSEDGEFYITSSARPFQFTSNNSDSSQFFPGQLYQVGDFTTPDSGIIDITSADKFANLDTGVDSYEDEVDTSPSSISRFAVSFNDQLLNRKSNSSRDITWEDEVDPASPTVDNFTETVAIESTKQEESPPAEMDPVSLVDSAAETDSKDGDNVLQSPSSPLSPSGLGELRHTRDRLKLDLPTSSKTFVLDPPAVGKRRSVETVKGEASLLDSGEETEDSGIGSSNGAVKLTSET